MGRSIESFRWRADYIWSQNCYNGLDNEQRWEAEAATLSALEKARLVVDAAADRQATDILLLDLAELSTLADYFVICSAATERQLRAVVNAIEEKLREAGHRSLQIEGTPDSGWVLLDYGDLIVHVFSPEERDYYGLDEFWAKARPVLKIQ